MASLWPMENSLFKYAGIVALGFVLFEYFTITSKLNVSGASGAGVTIK